MADQKYADGKIRPVNIGGKDIQGAKAGGVPGNDDLPIDQHTLNNKAASATACTFSVWTMIAGYFGVTKSLNETYQDTPDSVVKKSNGYVYSETGIMKAAGVDGITVKTYNERDNGKVTQTMIDTLNSGGIIHTRVSTTDKGGHSVVIDGYGFNENGNLYMKVRDPDSSNRYNFYDPSKGKLYNLDDNNEPEYDHRKLLRFQTAKKAN